MLYLYIVEIFDRNMIGLYSNVLSLEKINEDKKMIVFYNHYGNLYAGGVIEVEKQTYKKMIEHFGGVRIGNNVFVGSCTNIARGVLDDTVIDNNVKIAPSTHIGHNVRIGSNTTVICSNIFGSAEIGKDSYITASTVKNQKKVGENTVIGMGSVVNDSIDDNLIAYGIPAKGVRENDLKL